VRKQLEDEFGVPLKDRKALISGEVSLERGVCVS
jgi:hypothetical protein